MQFTDYTHFSLRALTFLALQPHDRLTTITEIADAFTISRNHMVKIIHQLGLKGYVETIRGRHGGIRLAKPATHINLRSVVIDMENILSPINCKEEDCHIVSACRVQGIMRRAMNAFLDVLDEYTLADIVKHPDRLCELLGIEHIPVKLIA